MSSVTPLFPDSTDGETPAGGDSAQVTFLTDVAQVWSGILGREVQPYEAALMLAGADLIMARREPEVVEHLQDVKAFVKVAEDVIS